jgi:hypothetical protein
VLPPPVVLTASAATTPLPTPLTSGDVKAGLGGWLILPLIGFIISPLRLVYIALIDTLPFIGTSDYEAIVDMEPAFGPLLWMEILGNLGFAVFAVVVLIAMFGKKRSVPGLAIAFYFLMFGFMAVDLMVAMNLQTLKELAGDGFWKDSIKDVFRAGMTLAIWGTYFNVSKRVKATFVND